MINFEDVFYLFKEESGEKLSAYEIFFVFSWQKSFVCIIEGCQNRLLSTVSARAMPTLSGSISTVTVRRAT